MRSQTSQPGHRTEEEDIGSGEKPRGQLETENMIEAVDKPLPNSEAQERQPESKQRESKLDGDEPDLYTKTVDKTVDKPDGSTTSN